MSNGSPRILLWLVLGAIMAPAVAAHDGPHDRSTAGSSIDYEVSIDIAKETFLVTGRMRGVAGDTINYYFPLWGPGAYDLVNFGGWVDNLTARDSKGKALRVVRVDSSLFRIVGANGSCDISYHVRDIERLETSPWFGTSDIEPGYVFANTVAIFGYPTGYKDIPCTVRYNPPAKWRVSVALDPVDTARHVYAARDYDELVDAPLQMGDYQSVEFLVNGIPHLISIISPRRLTPAELKDIRSAGDTVVRTISGFFGNMPYRRYVFQLFLVGYGTTDYSFGALEHRNSASYRMFIGSIANGASGLLAVFAHEYWHLWSPKRIHVHQLGPFDYQSPPRTKSIWFAEGLTEYYAQAMLARAGLLGDDRGNRAHLEAVFELTYGNRQTRSLTDLSMHAGQITMAQFIAFYSKGPVVGMLLDGAIRKRTGYRKSLDDAMRYFNEKYGKTGRSFGDDEIVTIMEEATGAKLGDFYAAYIDGMDPLPYDEYLPAIGLAIQKLRRDDVMMGIEVQRVGGDTVGPLVVTRVDSGASGIVSGLQVGDTILSQTMKGMRLTHEEPSTMIPRNTYDYPLSTRLVSLTIRRGTATMSLPVKRVAVRRVIITIIDDPDATPQAIAARKSIFGS